MMPTFDHREDVLEEEQLLDPAKLALLEKKFRLQDELLNIESKLTGSSTEHEEKPAKIWSEYMNPNPEGAA
jgi:hypothetical protein